MDLLRDTQGCLDCFVRSGTDTGKRDWAHTAAECPGRMEGEDGAISEADVDALRSRIRFDKQTHSCFKYGISQRLCETRESKDKKC